MKKINKKLIAYILLIPIVFSSVAPTFSMTVFAKEDPANSSTVIGNTTIKGPIYSQELLQKSLKGESTPKSPAENLWDNPPSYSPGPAQGTGSTIQPSNNNNPAASGFNEAVNGLGTGGNPLAMPAADGTGSSGLDLVNSGINDPNGNNSTVGVGNGGGPPDSHEDDVNGPCGAIWKLFSPSCLLYTFQHMFVNIIYRVTNYITYLAGSLFNASVVFSLNGDSFKSDMINTGWKTVRDFINIIFIFILLLIAISTIIQYGEYQGKGLLVGIIIAAVLVNFSLMMTKVVIDASHVLAWEFYNRIDVGNTAKRGDGQEFAEIPEDLQIRTGPGKTTEARNLANVFLDGFNPQGLIIPSNINAGNVETVTVDARGSGKGVEATWF